MIKFEDDVVVEYVFGMLEDRDVPVSHLVCRCSSGADGRCPILERCR